MFKKKNKIISEKTSSVFNLYKLKLENRKERETTMGDVTNPIYQKYLTYAFDMIDETVETIKDLSDDLKLLEINNLHTKYAKNLELFSSELYDSIKVDTKLKGKIEMQKFILTPFIRTGKITYMCDLYEYFMKDRRLIESSQNYTT